MDFLNAVDSTGRSAKYSDRTMHVTPDARGAERAVPALRGPQQPFRSRVREIAPRSRMHIYRIIVASSLAAFTVIVAHAGAQGTPQAPVPPGGTPPPTAGAPQ